MLGTLYKKNVMLPMTVKMLALWLFFTMPTSVHARHLWYVSEELKWYDIAFVCPTTGKALVDMLIEAIDEDSALKLFHNIMPGATIRSITLEQ